MIQLSRDIQCSMEDARRSYNMNCSRERERERCNSTKLCTPVSGATANSYRAGTLFPLSLCSPISSIFGARAPYLHRHAVTSAHFLRYACSYSSGHFISPCVRFRLSSIYVSTRLCFKRTNLLFYLIQFIYLLDSLSN